MRHLAALIAAVLPSACTAGTSSLDGGAASSDGGAGRGCDAGELCLCTPAVPISGTGCAPIVAGLACEYDGNASGACTALATCVAENAGTRPHTREPTHWMVTPPEAGCGQNGALCAATFGASEGMPCAPSGARCDYAEGRCGCEACETATGVSNGFLHCRRWDDVEAGCPSPRPLLGSPCETEGLVCDYAKCCRGPAVGPAMICHLGVWFPHVSGVCDCTIPPCP